MSGRIPDPGPLVGADPGPPRPPRLLAIVDVDACRAADVEPMAAVGIASEAGVPAVLFRCKSLPPDALRTLAAQAVRFAHYGGARALLSGNAALAIELGFDGVHLPFAQVADATAAADAGLLVGASTHSAAELLRAEHAGAHYVTLSPVWLTDSKPGYGPALGLDNLAALCRAAKVPVLALGGVTTERIGSARRAGAFGVAAMGPFSSKDGAGATRRYLKALRAAAV